MLHKAGFVPTRTILLNVSPATSLGRLTQRRYDSRHICSWKPHVCIRHDPVTGRRYHMEDAPPSADIEGRVVIHPRDREENVTKRIQTFAMFKDELLQAYEEVSYIHMYL